MFPGRVLNLMPFFWIGGMQELLSSMQSGATLLTLERLDAAAALELGRRERATSVMGNSKTMGALFGRRTSKRRFRRSGRNPRGAGKEVRAASRIPPRRLA